jgi:hypothetical protein
VIQNVLGKHVRAECAVAEINLVECLQFTAHYATCFLFGRAVLRFD